MTQAHPQFCAKPWARRGGRFLRTPRRWFLPRAGGLQPKFFGSPSVPPSFEENTGCPRENSLPPGFLIHRSPRRAILARRKLGVGNGFEPIAGEDCRWGRYPDFSKLSFTGCRDYGNEGVCLAKSKSVRPGLLRLGSKLDSSLQNLKI